MPKYENPITQTMVDAAADEMLREFDNDIEKVNANQVATRLGMPRGNQTFYEKFADWKRRRIEEGVLHAGMAPQHLREGLAQRLEVTSQEILAYACGMTGKAVAEDRKESSKEKGLFRDKIAALETRVVTLQTEAEEKDARIAALEKQLEFAGGQLVDLKTQLAAEAGKVQELRSMNSELMRFTNENSKPVEQARTQHQATDQKLADLLEIDPTRYDLEIEDDDEAAA